MHTVCIAHPFSYVSKRGVLCTPPIVRVSGGVLCTPPKGGFQGGCIAHGVLAALTRPIGVA